MKVLVLTAEAISAEQLRSAMPDGTEPSDSEVMIVAPALHDSPLKFWIGDADEAIERATRVQSASVQELKADGIEASGDTGEGDVLQAIQDALVTFPADRIVVFTHDEGSQGYREDVDAGLLRERFGIPVDQATVSGR